MSTGMLFLLVFAAFAIMGRSRRRLRGDRGWDANEDMRVELARVRETVEDLASRFHRLEAERDFYRELAAPKTEPVLERSEDRAAGPMGELAQTSRSYLGEGSP